MGRTATLARVFQSLRIVVNQEDVALEKALTSMAPSLLRPGGRLVVLSYHSMEDRATKRVMRDGTVSKQEAHLNNEQKDIYGNYIGVPKPFRTLGKPQKATEEEIESNVRARSATMRVAERQVSSVWKA
jgi:16S rRNA (cytosine1402-N4)-methyltransferase